MDKSKPIQQNTVSPGRMALVIGVCLALCALVGYLLSRWFG
jgi:hypothetical protein